jgi:membrane protein DedA with SNARE-associated domain
MVWMGGWNVAVATIVANLIGGCIFFWVDRWIFGDKKVRSRKKKATADAEELVRAEVVIDDEGEDLG